MNGTFQTCRHSLPQSALWLNLLIQVLESVKQQRKLIVEIPDDLLSYEDDYSTYYIRKSRVPRSRIRGNWVKIRRRMDEKPSLSTLRELLLGSGFKPEVETSLSTQNEQLFSLIYVGTHELQRLWSVGNKDAVRSIGYALHNIPRLLWYPHEFDAKSYQFCFRIISTHWGNLSQDMQETLCQLIGLDLTLVPILINSPDFSIDW